MSVSIKSGIGFSVKTGALYLDMGAAFSEPARPVKQVPAADYQLLSVLPWSPWGADNLLGYQYIRDIETCGVLSSIIDGKARFALCQGMVPAIVHTDPTTGQRVIDKIVDDEEITDFLELNNQFDHVYGWMRDMNGFGWEVMRIMLDAEGKKIVRFQRDDITEIRMAKMDPATAKINFLYYSAAWDRLRSPNDSRIFKIPLLDPANPLDDLTEKAAAGGREFAMIIRVPGWNKKYYPVPAWMAAYKWVKIAQGVPEMKASLFENSMRPKYKVIIQEEFWDNRYGTDWGTWDEDEQEEKKQAFYDEIDAWLVGSKNAHKSIFVNGFRDGDGKVYTDVDIVPIEDTTKVGELLPDSAAANSEIAIAMLWNNAVSGGNQKGSIYSSNGGGSDVREATLLQTIVTEVERNTVKTFMNLIKRFNGWHKKFKGLEFIIPATILTTTDTGSGSKPIVPGNASTKDPKKSDINGS